MTRSRLLYIPLLFTIVSAATAQNSSFLADGVQDFVRRQQLLGKVPATASLLVSDFRSGMDAMDSLLPSRPGKHKPLFAPAVQGNQLFVKWLPAGVGLQYNSHHAYGLNNGVMIPAKGGEAMVSGGVLLEAGRFSLQLKPEAVLAQNPVFETFPHEHYDVYWSQYYRLLNTIDLPERFGDRPYQKVFAGQSALRYRAGPVSLEISTENMWWGPGRYNALVMSNNAPGFLHATVNTITPIQTAIGSFEGQLIAGNLSSSDIAPPDTLRYYNGTRLYQAKNEESRYLAALVLSWQPRWTRGLFIGFTTASYLYRSAVGIGDILPLQLIRSEAAMQGKKASLGSLFARYVMPEEKAELYFEFGRNDKSPDLINVVTENGYPRAYVAGFRKLFATKRKDQFIELASEFTQMELPTGDLIGQGISWYAHPFVRQGYTQQGRVLGAGIGPGSNSQLLDISWVKGFAKAGLQFERIARNQDFYYRAFVITQDFTRHWIDISTTLHANYQKGPFLISGDMALIRSLNYEWYILPDLGYFKNGYDVLNFHARFSLSYQF